MATTGENEQGLRKILDLTRLLSLAVLIIHFCIECYPIIVEFDLSSTILEGFLGLMLKFNIFQSVVAKPTTLLLLFISLLGVKGKKDETVQIARTIGLCIIGLMIFFFSSL